MRQFFFYLTLLLPLTFLSCQNTSGEGQANSSGDEQTANEMPFQNIEVGAFREKMQEENIVILDVRTPAEIAEGKIEGALEIDYKGADFEQKIDELDKSKTYLVYCRSGGRSSRSCEVMADKEFESLYNLTGGFTVWSATETKE